MEQTKKLTYEIDWAAQTISFFCLDGRVAGAYTHEFLASSAKWPHGIPDYAAYLEKLGYVPRGVQEDKPAVEADGVFSVVTDHGMIVFDPIKRDYIKLAPKRTLPHDLMADAWPTDPRKVNVNERKHPRLTWADEKPADRWEGFTVKSNPGPQSEQTKGPLSLSTNTNVVQLPAVCGSGHIALGKG